jgi:hypothetical protein
MGTPNIASMPNKDTNYPGKIPKGTDLNNTGGLFLIRTANECLQDAKGRPIPKKLFFEFWFEGELCILFADTGLGKSILSVQIGNELSQQGYVVLYFTPPGFVHD